MQLVVEVKNIYGVERIYPINDKAIFLTQLTNKKTLDSKDIELIKKLGYQIEVINKKL
jgi:hypothetical protein